MDFGTQPFLEINPGQHDFGGPGHLGVGQWHARNLLPESDAEVVPDFELQSLVGSSHRLHASDGAVFLYFFAPWCTVCRFSISNLNDLPSSSTKNDAKVYAVALDWNNVGEVEGFAKTKLEVPVLLGNRGTAKDFRIQAFPTYYVLDGSKKVVAGMSVTAPVSVCAGISPGSGQEVLASNFYHFCLNKFGFRDL